MSELTIITSDDERIEREALAAGQTFLDRVLELYARGMHTKRKYRSFTGYFEATFAGLEVPRILALERPDKVRQLSASGMSTREIAAVTGADQNTVRRDLGTMPKAQVHEIHALGATDADNERDAIAAMDHTPWPVPSAHAPVPAPSEGVTEDTEEVLDAELVEDEDNQGTESKALKPRKPLKSAIDTARVKMGNLGPILNTVRRDDRFPSARKGMDIGWLKALHTDLTTFLEEIER